MDANAERVQESRAKWRHRLTEELSQLDEQTRWLASSATISALVKGGEIGFAKAVIDDLLPPSRRKPAHVALARSLAEIDRMDEALEVVERLSAETEDDVIGREGVLAEIAIARARSGAVKDALGLIPQLKRNPFSDQVLREVAKAQARAGDFSAARDTAHKIAQEFYRIPALRDILDAQQGKERPIGKIQSSFLRTRISRMIDGVGTHAAASGMDLHAHAIQALAAAQQNDLDALKAHTEAALAKLDGSLAVHRASTHALLAVALAEAGQREEAKKRIGSAREAAKGDPSISGIFVSPVLVHLMIRLDMTEGLQDLMSDARRNFDSAHVASQVVLTSLGGTLAELGRLDDAEEYYDQLESAAERVYFSAGILTYLQQADPEL